MTTRLIHHPLVQRTALAALVFVYFAITVRDFATAGNMYAVLESCALIGIVAAGLGVTMLAGELDLSVGSVAACAGIIAVQMSHLGVVAAVASGTVLAVLFGIVQGALIAKLQISSLVFTLGTFIGLRGLAYVLSKEKTVNLALSDLAISTNMRERFLIFSPFSLFMIMVLVAVGCILRYLRIGREVYAIGGARKESRAAGVSQTRPLVFAFGLSAGLAALAGALASLRGASATPAGYETLLLAAVTAALIGGVSVRRPWKYGRNLHRRADTAVPTLRTAIARRTFLGGESGDWLGSTRVPGGGYRERLLTGGPSSPAFRSPLAIAHAAQPARNVRGLAR